jgi:hypothetical protein
VLRTDLSALNLTIADFGALQGASASGIEGCEGRRMMEAFLGGSPLLLARHPNPFPNGTWRWMQVNGAPAPPPPHNRPAPPGSSTRFVWRESDDGVVSKWGDEPDPWVQGYFQFDWTDSINRVVSFGSSNRTVQLDPATPTVCLNHRVTHARTCPGARHTLRLHPHQLCVRLAARENACVHYF